MISLAVFRRTQTYEARCNLFYDLPNTQWHGTTLLNKKDLKPIKGFNPPLISSNPEGVSNNNLLSLDNCADIVTKYEYNYLAMANNFGMSQYSYILSNIEFYQGMADSNYLNKIPKNYVVDSINPNIIYFVHIAPNFLSKQYLVKYDLSNNRVIWFKLLMAYNDYYQSNTVNIYRIINIFKQDKNSLYAIVKASNSNYGYVCMSQRGIVVLSKETGEIKKNIIYPMPEYKNINCEVYKSTKYIGRNTYNAGLPLMYIDEIGEDILFFTSFDNTNMRTDNFLNDKFYLNKTNKEELKLDYVIGFVKYNPGNHSFDTDGLIKSPFTFKEIYDRNSSTLNRYSSVFSGDTSNIPFNHEYSGLSGGYIHIPYCTDIDRNYKDKYVVYSLWGLLYPFINKNIDENNEENKKILPTIYRFEYNKVNNSQKAIRLKVLNMDNEEIKLDDWKFINKTIYGNYNYSTYSKPYLIYNNKDKYILLYCNKCSTGRFDKDSTYNSADNNKPEYLFLFKFIDENILKLVDTKEVLFNDIMWIREDKFIGLERDKLSIYRIDYDLNEIKLLKVILPVKNDNYFTFTTVDNNGNLWYTEVIKNKNYNRHNNLELNYINDETIESITLIKEANEYIYREENPNNETYIRIEVKNIYEELLERTVQIDIEGPAKFKSNGLSRIVLKSSKETYIEIPITITGLGEVKYNVKATNI